MEQQIAKVDLHNKDASFLRHALLTMYANPLINYLKAAKDKNVYRKGWILQSTLKRKLQT